MKGWEVQGLAVAGLGAGAKAAGDWGAAKAAEVTEVVGWAAAVRGVVAKAVGDQGAVARAEGWVVAVAEAWVEVEEVVRVAGAVEVEGWVEVAMGVVVTAGADWEEAGRAVEAKGAAVRGEAAWVVVGLAGWGKEAEVEEATATARVAEAVEEEARAVAGWVEGA